ncbi:hypothetical protein TRIUR3_03047 [Triticum urartu]|uniref:Uncharacterized protein n=1 Tax=Triticum urartu TaxID=4572 RepID=M7YW22_TRIUA|nr:hypothetical protein TRIUR3_03047 [Triticum urartu]
MKDHHPPASPLGSGERSPFKDLTNTPTHVNANQAGEKLQEQTPKSGQNWFARMSDEKRAEYNQKRCIARARRHLLHYDLLTAPTVQRCMFTESTPVKAAYSTNFLCRSMLIGSSSTLILDLPFLLPFANLTTSLSHVVSEDVLCVMSTRVFDGKSRKDAYEVNQGSW